MEKRVRLVFVTNVSGQLSSIVLTVKCWQDCILGYNLAHHRVRCHRGYMQKFIRTKQQVITSFLGLCIVNYYREFSPTKKSPLLQTVNSMVSSKALLLFE